jgi:hypothetical protein
MRDIKSIPTPFRVAEPTRESHEFENQGAPSSNGRCSFPGCSYDLPKVCGIDVSFAVPVKQNDTRSEYVILRLRACDYHSHLMKGRKLKKEMNIVQHSHMRNLLETLMVLTGRYKREGTRELLSMTTEGA